MKHAALLLLLSCTPEPTPIADDLIQAIAEEKGVQLSHWERETLIQETLNGQDPREIWDSIVWREWKPCDIPSRD